MLVSEVLLAIVLSISGLFGSDSVQTAIEEERQSIIAESLETGYHEVRVGDTLGKLASWYDTNVSTLASYNGIHDINFIVVGQKLQVSGFTARAAVGDSRAGVPSATTGAPSAPSSGGSSVVTPAPSVSASTGSYREIIARYFPEQVDKAYRIFLCESGGNPHNKINPKYRGAWQFDYPTWASVGGSGDPADASMEEQTMRARMLYDKRGWQPWECV